MTLKSINKLDLQTGKTEILIFKAELDANLSALQTTFMSIFLFMYIKAERTDKFIHILQEPCGMFMEGD